MQEGEIWLWLILLGLLLIAGGLLVSTETAMVAMSDAKLKKLAEEGDRRAKRIIKMLAEPSRFMLAVQAGSLMITVAGGIAFGIGIALPLYYRLKTVMNGLLALLIILVIFFFFGMVVLVFGNLLPKRLSGAKPEKTALKRAGAIKLIYFLTRPFCAMSDALANKIAFLFGVTPGEEDEQATEEEIRLLMDVGQEKGVIEESEKTMINNIFEFGDMIAAEAMTHRTAITAISEDAPLKEALDLAMAEGCSRLPVYRNDLDTIVGIVYVKDLLRYVGMQLPKDITLTSVMRKAYFVPESMRCSDLLTQLTSRHLQLAIVVDEYGGTAGLVTVEDLLESIVGNIRDEYDLKEAEQFTVIDSNHYEVDGSLPLDELVDLIGCDLPEGDYDTVGGLLLSELERIPGPGEHPEVNIEGIVFKVLSVENLRISRVHITLPQKGPEE